MAQLEKQDTKTKDSSNLHCGQVWARISNIFPAIIMDYCC